MYLFWRYLAESFNLPNDIIHYGVVEFFVPFAQADKERLKIEEGYNAFFDENGMPKKTLLGEVETTQLTRLLEDESIRLDTRITDGRIELLIHIINEFICDITPRILYILKKGLVVNSIITFEILNMTGHLGQCVDETKAFITHIIERMRLSAPLLPGDVKPQLLVTLFMNCLEVGIIDDRLTQLLIACYDVQGCLRDVLEGRCHLTENKRLNMDLYEKRMIACRSLEEEKNKNV